MALSVIGASPTSVNVRTEFSIDRERVRDFCSKKSKRFVFERQPSKFSVRPGSNFTCAESNANEIEQ